MNKHEVQKRNPGYENGKKKILHIVSNNALNGGIGTIINYLSEGLNQSSQFYSDTLLTGYSRSKVPPSNKSGRKYLFRPKESILKKFDSSGSEIDEKKYKHEDLEEKLGEYDVIHVHGIPHYGILEHLESMKSKGTSPKIVNTAHSSVKKEFLAHYNNIKNNLGNKNNKNELINLDLYLKNNILNDPSKFSENYWGSAIWRQEKIMTLSDIVQHMNEEYKNQIIDEYSAHENASKHLVLPNGVKMVSTSKKRPNKKRILFVGRFAKEKGIDELIDSIPYIMEKHPDSEIKFVGGDKSGKKVQQFKNKLSRKIKSHFKGITKGGLEKKLSKVHFTGWISDPKEIKKHYEWTDYVIIPSHAESFSLTASEALMYNRLPIITGTPALRDLYINKGIALEIDPEKRTGKDIAETLDKIFNEDPKKHDKMIKLGNKFVKENYSFDKMIENQSKLYTNLVRSKNNQ